MNSPLSLTPEGCRGRQARLRERLRAARLDAALLTDPRHVHYLTGYWSRGVFLRAAVVFADGPTLLATAFPDDATPATADERLAFEGTRHGSLVDDQRGALLAALFTTVAPRLRGAAKLGIDDGFAFPLGGAEAHDLGPTLRDLRRTKDADEVAMLRRGIEAIEAVYAAAQGLLDSGVREIDLFAETLRIATRVVGEPIGELGNDFQSGSPGGPPRDRVPQKGEFMPLDLGVSVRGYTADLCRTFSIGRDPDAAQREAHRMVLESLDLTESHARPGVSCRELHAEVFKRIDGHKGWKFPHHLGHGIGLSPHEAPRLIPGSDDVLRVGDVFTCEPGLYGEGLGGGVRVEDDFLVTASGVERLSKFPRTLW